MRVFNTGSGGFWSSQLGQQLRFLRLVNPQYHRARPVVLALVEKVAHLVLPHCRRHGNWPKIDVRQNMVTMEWRARGELTVALDGSRLSYTPDPIRKSSTLGMVLDLSGGPNIERFLKGVCWHLLEVRP